MVLVVIPVEREWILKPLDSGLRRNDGAAIRLKEYGYC